MTGDTFGATATYTCDTGFTLNGMASRICQADGSWTDPVPVCEGEDVTFFSLYALSTTHTYEQHTCPSTFVVEELFSRLK